MACEHQLRHSATALAPLPRLGVCGAGMGRMTPARALNFHGRKAGSVIRGRWRWAVHTETRVRQQTLRVRCQYHLVEHGPSHIVCQPPRPVPGEDGRIKAALQQVHVQEPTEQLMSARLTDTSGSDTGAAARVMAKRALRESVHRDSTSQSLVALPRDGMAPESVVVIGPMDARRRATDIGLVVSILLAPPAGLCTKSS